MFSNRFISFILSAVSALFIYAEKCPLGTLSGLIPDKTSIYIEDLRTGDAVIDYNGDLPLIPASITKAVTSACVLTTHGPDPVFTTSVDLQGYVNDSILYGDVIINTIGDPTLGSSKLPGSSLPEEISSALTELGVRTIKGQIIVKPLYRIDESAPEGWLESDLKLPYGTVFSPSTYNDNTFTFSIASGDCVPTVPDLKINRTKQKSSKRRVKVEKHPHKNNVTVSGKTKSKSATIELPNSSPHLSIIADVKETLEKNGFTISEDSEKPDYSELLHLVSHRSENYSEILRSLMYRSDNLFAEGMLRTLSQWGTRDDAIQFEKKLFEEWDIDFADVNIEDGCGLSRNNRMTAHFMSDVLYKMANSEQSDLYISLFPKVGEEGTVKKLLALSPLKGRLALKSGSMNGVKCYAGYCLDELSRPTHIVVIMINSYTGRADRLKNAIESLLLNEFS